MLQRTGSRPLARRTLIVDSGLADSIGAASRAVHALADELDARNIEVVESVSCEDGHATATSDAGIDCILINWTQGSNDKGTHDEATELLRAVRHATPSCRFS